MPENNPVLPQEKNQLEKAGELEWLDNTIPVSTRFDDPYYSKADGLAETGHVFIGGNDLSARWPQLDYCTIAELGFGTGLNFLATLAALPEPPALPRHLHFITFEKYPMAPADMLKALGRWPQLSTSARKLAGLLECARPTAEKDIRIAWSERVKLTICLGDATQRLRGKDFLADAWYLDGFAPARNPDLWSAELLAKVHACTRPGGTFATYTAAGWVRRNLRAAGFEVAKVAGHASKREMMIGKKSQ